MNCISKDAFDALLILQLKNIGLQLSQDITNFLTLYYR